MRAEERLDDRTLAGWTARERPAPAAMEGRLVRLEPLDMDRHLEGLWPAVGAVPELWRYIFDGPFADREAFAAWLATVAARPDWVPFAIVKRAGGGAIGLISYMRIETGHGVAEIGCVLFGPALKRSTEATEAIALMAAHVFDGLGYRRLEWKCDTRNEASRAAATRFGFRFEGIFRNHMVLKGQNRDTAWLAITDAEWAGVKAALASWLAPENFDADGRQRRRLADFRPVPGS